MIFQKNDRVTTRVSFHNSDRRDHVEHDAKKNTLPGNPS